VQSEWFILGFVVFSFDSYMLESLALKIIYFGFCGYADTMSI
jgi:hypothetical protein